MEKKRPDQQEPETLRTGQERRAGPRYAACFPAQIVELWQNADCAAVSHDVNRFGGLFLTREELHAGDPVKVRLFLDGDFARPQVAYARVVRSARRNHPTSFWPYDAAVQFDRPVESYELAARRTA